MNAKFPIFSSLCLRKWRKSVTLKLYQNTVFFLCTLVITKHLRDGPLSEHTLRIWYMSRSTKQTIINKTWYSCFSTTNIGFWRKNSENKYFQNNKTQPLTNFHNKIRSISGAIWFRGNSCSELLGEHYCREIAYAGLHRWYCATTYRVMFGNEGKTFWWSIRSLSQLQLSSGLVSQDIY